MVLRRYGVIGADEAVFRFDRRRRDEGSRRTHSFCCVHFAVRRVFSNVVHAGECFLLSRGGLQASVELLLDRFSAVCFFVNFVFVFNLLRLVGCIVLGFPQIRSVREAANQRNLVWSDVYSQLCFLVRSGPPDPTRCRVSIGCCSHVLGARRNFGWRC